MAAHRLDPRVIIAVIIAVALAYWLIIPREDPAKMLIKTGDFEKYKHKHKGAKKSNHKHGKHEGLGLGHVDHMGEHGEASAKKVLQDTIDRLKHDLKQSEMKIEKLKEDSTKKDTLLKEAKKKRTALEQEKAGRGVVATSAKEEVPDKAPFSGHRLVHLDLKGAAPKLEYLKKLLPFIKTFGATGLLMEYEDTFPFEGELKILRSKDAYTKRELLEFLAIAKELELTVIPLIQTFGHLEFVLKHKKYANLRETEKITSSICPLKNESKMLMKEIIRDVLKLHPDSEWIHLGGDEVWNLKSCAQCKKSSKSSAELFLYHMIPLFEYVEMQSEGKVIPIIWDDMMRHWDVKDLQSMAKYVEPMIWAYVPNLENYYKFPNGMWDRYNKAFERIWIASSYKGADKPVSNYVPIQQHITNHISWMNIISKFPKTMQVVGIALTGWSRFDHDAQLCELLPAGIPSLAFCLTVLRKGSFDEKLHKGVSTQLGFKEPLPISVTNFKAMTIQDSNFPGTDVFNMVSRFEKARGWYNAGKVREDGWAGRHQIKSNHLSFYQLNTTVNAANVCIDMLVNLEPQARKLLPKYFSERIVNEWVADKIKDTIQKAKTMKVNVLKVMKNIR